MIGHQVGAPARPAFCISSGNGTSSCPYGRRGASAGTGAGAGAAAAHGGAVGYGVCGVAWSGPA